MNKQDVFNRKQKSLTCLSSLELGESTSYLNKNIKSVHISRMNHKYQNVLQLINLLLFFIYCRHSIFIRCFSFNRSWYISYNAIVMLRYNNFVKWFSSRYFDNFVWPVMDLHFKFQLLGFLKEVLHYNFLYKVRIQSVFDHFRSSKLQNKTRVLIHVYLFKQFYVVLKENCVIKLHIEISGLK